MLIASTYMPRPEWFAIAASAASFTMPIKVILRICYVRAVRSVLLAALAHVHDYTIV